MNTLLKACARCAWRYEMNNDDRNARKKSHDNDIHATQRRKTAGSSLQLADLRDCGDRSKVSAPE